LAALASSPGGVLVFSPDGHLLAASDAGNVHIWDVTDPTHPQSRAILFDNTHFVDVLAFSPDGNLLATGGFDQTARVWDVADPTQPSLVMTLPGHAAAVTSLAFSPDGQTLAGGSGDQSVFLWDVADPGTSTPLASLSGSAGPVAFSPDSKFVAAGDPAELWDISDPAAPRAVAPLVPLNVAAAFVQGLTFSPGGRLLAMDDGSDTQLWELTRPAQPKLVASLTGSSGLQDSTFSSDGRELITSDSLSPRIWDIHVPSRPVLVPGPDLTAPKGIKVSVDGSSVPAADVAGVWQASSPATTESLVNWVNQNKAANIIGFSPQAGMLATLVGSSQQLILSYAEQLDLWSVGNAAHPLASLTSSIGGLLAAAISPDGKLLAAASEMGVTIWDISDPAHPAALTTLNFSFAGAGPYLAFSDNGSYLATGGYGASDQIWEVDAPGIVNRLCVESGSPITAAQWNQYIPGVTYARPCSPNAYLPGAGSEDPPYIPPPPAQPVRVPVSNLHSVDWQDTPLPGEFCAVPGLVTMRKGLGWASSLKWGRVQFFLGSSPVTYGDLQGGGTQDAAVQVWCANGGGTADSEIAEAYLIFSMHDRTLRLIGATTPQEQPPDEAHISIFSSISISPGSVMAHEAWYRAGDPTCCPSGTAVTVWTYAHGRLVPGTPDITS
jgi:WD40 repeat protein